MGKKTLHLILAVLTVTALVLVARQGNTQEAYPTRPVLLVPCGSPGGGLDIHARAIERTMALEKLFDKPFSVLNKGGGGGNICTAYMVGQKGGDALAINDNRILLGSLMGTTEYGQKDITPIARLTTDYEVWAVRADSKYKSALEVLADLKKDPTSVTFGVGTVPGSDQFSVLLPAKAQGIDFPKIKIVAFASGGDAMAQLLGGHVPILASSMAELMAQVDAGKIRILAVSSPSKIDRLGNVPTWKDLGIDVTIYMWRGVYGPPDMPKIASDYWKKKFAEMVKTPTWKEMMAKYQVYDSYLSADEFEKFLDKEQAQIAELLGKMGMLKKVSK